MENHIFKQQILKTHIEPMIREIYKNHGLVETKEYSLVITPDIETKDLILIFSLPEVEDAGYLRIAVVRHTRNRWIVRINDFLSPEKQSPFFRVDEENPINYGKIHDSFEEAIADLMSKIKVN